MGRRVVFLDRDGTLCDDVGVVSHIGQLKFFSWLPSTLRSLQGLGFDLAVVTNQAAVGKGLITEREVIQVHRDMETLFASWNVSLLEVGYCPHHPEARLKDYRRFCACRKPGSAMITDMAARYDIDLAQSWMVGDNVTDVLAGAAAGCHCALVMTGHGQPYHSAVSPTVLKLLSLQELPRHLTYLEAKSAGYGLPDTGWPDGALDCP